MCRDLDLGEFWVRLLFSVVVFLIEERNQIVYLLRLGFMTLGISYLSVSWVLECVCCVVWCGVCVCV